MNQSTSDGKFSRRATLFKTLTVATVLATGLWGCGGGGGSDGNASGSLPLSASWTASMQDGTSSLTATPVAAATFNNETVRQVVRLSLGGDSLRVKLSNLFGKAPITFSGVRIARSTGASSIDTASDRAVLFGGQNTVTVAPGTEVSSDDVALSVSPLSNVAISSYFSSLTSVPTVHSLGRQTAYVGAGNQLSAPSVPVTATSTRQSYYGLTAVETASIEKTRVVVTFGDSITDGFNSTVDASKRYPNQLDDRLKATGAARTAVVNSGISGNRWLNDVAGPNGNGRFERDVLNTKGVTHAIILLGINDIGFSEALVPAQAVSADQIINSINTAVAKAKARGIKVFVGTLLPYKGAGYYSVAGEAKRQAVNNWIRTNAQVDGVVDYDKTMQSATDPLAMNPAYDSGDHLHPNDLGYGAMAATVDLSKLQ